MSESRKISTLVGSDPTQSRDQLRQVLVHVRLDEEELSRWLAAMTAAEAAKRNVNAMSLRLEPPPAELYLREGDAGGAAGEGDEMARQLMSEEPPDPVLVPVTREFLGALQFEDDLYGAELVVQPGVVHWSIPGFMESWRMGPEDILYAMAHTRPVSGSVELFEKIARKNPQVALTLMERGIRLVGQAREESRPLPPLPADAVASLCGSADPEIRKRALLILDRLECSRDGARRR